MSTKIHNGYIIEKSFDILELLKFLKDFQDKAQQERDRQTSRFLTSEFIRKFDKETILGEKPDPIEILSQMWIDVSTRAHKVYKTNQRDPLVDFGCEVTIIPHNDKLLALLFCEQKTYEEIWKSYPFVKDYHYQNSTDKPDTISREDWDERSQNWDEAIPTTPAENGFSFTVVDYSWPIFQKSDLNLYLPSIEERIHNAALLVLQEEFLKTQNVKNSVDIIPALRQWKEYLDSTKGKKALANKKEKISRKLIKVRF